MFPCFVQEYKVFKLHLPPAHHAVQQILLPFTHSWERRKWSSERARSDICRQSASSSTCFSPLADLHEVRQVPRLLNPNVVQYGQSLTTFKAGQIPDGVPLAEAHQQEHQIMFLICLGKTMESCPQKAGAVPSSVDATFNTNCHY